MHSKLSGCFVAYILERSIKIVYLLCYLQICKAEFICPNIYSPGKYLFPCHKMPKTTYNIANDINYVDKTCFKSCIAEDLLK